MKAFIRYHDGHIKESTMIDGGFEFNKKGIILNYPEDEVMEITESEFKKIKDDLSRYEIIDGKIHKKRKTKIEELDKQRKEWRDLHSMDSLNQRLKDIEDKFGMLK